MFVFHNLDLAIADPVSQRPRSDSQISGGLDNGEEFICRHRYVPHFGLQHVSGPRGPGRVRQCALRTHTVCAHTPLLRESP